MYRVYDPYSGRVSITRNVHFDEVHYYDKKDIKPKEFADDEWHKEDDELFANLRNILDTSKAIPDFNIILCKSFETYPYSNESRSLSSFLDIPYPVEDKEHHEDYNATPEDQLKREIDEWSYLYLKRKDRDLSIQLSDAAPKRSCHNRLTEPTSGI